MSGSKDETVVLDQNDKDQEDELFREYVIGIGDRIRAVRTSRGMIRKDLSRQSGVSERYIAQVETGKANISVFMLWKISNSMGVKIPELFPDCDFRKGNAALMTYLMRLDHDQQEDALSLLKRHYSKSTHQTNGVALIGLRGAGKSSLGRMLADQYGVRFVKISDLIEKCAQMTTGELFSLGGQKAYRRMEKQALEEVIKGQQNIVLETGGSIVAMSDTFKLLLDSYYTVWVKASPEEHMNRVLAQGDLRPMANNKEAMEDLKLILQEREAEYSQADYVLDTSGRTLIDCVQEMSNQCGEYLTVAD
jgi:XRE family transcriptional regulator, aerobic/anaerobic benzoate catabolism transcriptional regulator